MKILLVGLLLISCGIDDEKDTDDQKDPSVSEAGDLASKHEGTTIFSFVRCNEGPVPVLDTAGNPVTGEDRIPKTETHPYCNYHRIAENDDCGSAGNQCQISVLPVVEDDATVPKPKGWHLFRWEVGCTCSKEKLSEELQSGSYRCVADKCSLNDLQEGIVKKATRNGKPIGSDNKFSKLEKDLLEDMVKDAFENLPKDTMFADYFAEDEED